MSTAAHTYRQDQTNAPVAAIGIKAHARTPHMKVGSLFSGIGGFDLGFERAGMQVVWQSEIEPYPCAVLRKHWPQMVNHGDIRSIRSYTVEPVDVLCGGFPCQDISVAGKGVGIDGERSGLWREYARLVRELRPRWVVAENVPALRTRGYGWVADDLEAAGYTVQALVVGADDIGAPHRRKRVWIIAYADATRKLQPSESQPQQRRWIGNSYQEITAGRYWDETAPEPTIRRMDDGIPAGLHENRRQRLAALGNALVPQIAEAIGRAIITVENSHQTKHSSL